MATLKFFIKGKRNPSTIYLRFRDGREIDITSSTNITVNPEYWNNSKGTIRKVNSFHEKIVYEARLKALESIVYRERNKRLERGLPINKKWLKELILEIHGKGNVDDYFIAKMRAYKEGLTTKLQRGKKGVSRGTINNYTTTEKRLKRFEDFTSRKYRLIDIDIDFHESYMRFATTELGLSINSIGKDFKQIKTVCRHFKDIGEKINEQVLSRKFSTPSEPTVFTTLNEEELNLLFNYQGKQYLENARDWLLIGCWTGCRVSDLMKFNLTNVSYNMKKRPIIQYTQNKTGKTVNVPMHWQVESIIDRLQGFPRPISLAKFNKYIKEVCREVGMTYSVEGTLQNKNTHRKEVGVFEKWELIKSHTCRRSFATNHYNQLPNKIIMAVTGHATEKMLLNYIGETEIDHIDDYFELWDSGDKEIPMSVIKTSV